MPKAAHDQAAKKRPEHKINLPGGISIAIWLNTNETERGPRKSRSITLTRRYFDPDTKTWKDGAYRPSDLPVLAFGLQKAVEYVFTTPIPGQEDEHGHTPF